MVIPFLSLLVGFTSGSEFNSGCWGVWGSEKGRRVEREHERASFAAVNLNVTQSSLTICDPKGYSLPGSSIHGIFPARILEWIAIPFSRGTSWPGAWTWVSCITGRVFTVCATREPSSAAGSCYFFICLLEWPQSSWICRVLACGQSDTERT